MSVLQVSDWVWHKEGWGTWLDQTCNPANPSNMLVRPADPSFLQHREELWQGCQGQGQQRGDWGGGRRQQQRGDWWPNLQIHPLCGTEKSPSKTAIDPRTIPHRGDNEGDHQPLKLLRNINLENEIGNQNWEIKTAGITRATTNHWNYCEIKIGKSKLGE